MREKASEEKCNIPDPDQKIPLPLYNNYFGQKKFH